MQSRIDSVNCWTISWSLSYFYSELWKTRAVTERWLNQIGKLSLHHLNKICLFDRLYICIHEFKRLEIERVGNKKNVKKKFSRQNSATGPCECFLGTLFKKSCHSRDVSLIFGLLSTTFFHSLGIKSSYRAF